MKFDSVEQLVADIAKDLPRFEDGRIDYSEANRAPVINAAVFAGDELLITKRSDDLHFYPGVWNGVSGFIDELVPLEELVTQEINEELGVEGGRIGRIAVGDVIERESSKHDRTWMIFPILVELKAKPDITLDWEHSDYAWIAPGELDKYEILADFDNVVKQALKLKES